MLRHHQPEEVSTAPLATPEELAEAVALLRRQKEEEQRRLDESEALVAALAELGDSVTREELLEAVALVRARKAVRSGRRAHWRRPALLAAGVTGMLVVPFVLIRLMIVPAPVTPPSPPVAADVPRIITLEQGAKDYWLMRDTFDSNIYHQLQPKQ